MRKVQASKMTQGWEAEVLNCPDISDYHYFDIADTDTFHYHDTRKRGVQPLVGRPFVLSDIKAVLRQLFYPS